MDFARAPDWVFKMWPDAKAVDRCGSGVEVAGEERGAYGR